MVSIGLDTRPSAFGTAVKKRLRKWTFLRESVTHTHTVKTGGDVTHIFLNILPRLAPGVLVHVHDIFLPYEYPRDWVVAERRLWAEQYILQAFLAFNDGFEVIFPAHAVARTAPELVAALIPSFGPEVMPGAFWMRRRDAGRTATTRAG